MVLLIEIPAWIWSFSGWAYSALVLVCVLLALLRKREPAQALGWSLAIVFLPVIGVLAFLVIGNRRINRRLARKIRHHRSYAKAANAQSPGEPLETAASLEGSRWGAVSRMLERLGQPPSRTGNDTVLFADSVTAFEAIREAILAATHHIHVESYIFRDDSFGRLAVDLLCEKARAGVEVRVIVDALGSLWVGDHRRRLRENGGEVISFLPLSSGVQLISPNLRNHRKIVVCDGRVGFFGGLNIGREYLVRRRDRGRPWADLHMRLTGPAVTDLQNIFVEDWDFATSHSLTDDAYFPRNETTGHTPVQILAGGPDLRPNPIRLALLAALSHARDRIVIATPYFVPDTGLRDVLELAAMSEVEVTVLMQHPPPDSWTTFLCGLFYANDLNQAGGQVRGYTGGFMHAKAIVVDSEWAMLGSANLDQRSMFLNFEVMAVFDSPAAARGIERAIDAMLEESIPYDEDWLASRPWMQRVLTPPARLLAPLL